MVTLCRRQLGRRRLAERQFPTSRAKTHWFPPVGCPRNLWSEAVVYIHPQATTWAPENPPASPPAYHRLARTPSDKGKKHSTRRAGPQATCLTASGPRIAIGVGSSRGLFRMETYGTVASAPCQGQTARARGSNDGLRFPVPGTAESVRGIEARMLPRCGELGSGLLGDVRRAETGRTDGGSRGQGVLNRTWMPVLPRGHNSTGGLVAPCACGVTCANALPAASADHQCGNGARYPAAEREQGHEKEAAAALVQHRQRRQ